MAQTPSRSRIPAPSRQPTTTPGTTRTQVLRAQKSASSLKPPAPSSSRTSPSPTPTKPVPTLKPKPSSSDLRTSPAPTPTRSRARTPVTATRQAKRESSPPPTPSLDTAMSKLSIREQIAQRRAQARQNSNKPDSSEIDAEWGNGKGVTASPVEEDILGRGTVLQDVAMARTSGKLDLSFRSLQALPYELFHDHLGVEPSFPPPPSPSALATRREIKQPAYWECVDLISLKAKDNEIQELQDEISGFCSMKILDFNRNKLSSLPPSFGTLVQLVSLDLSNNSFTEFPPQLSHLDALLTLELSHNGLTTLGDLPSSIHTLNVSHCKLTLEGLKLPVGLITLDISHNPLGPRTPLSSFLSTYTKLKSLNAASCDLKEDDFQGEGWWTTRLDTLELGGVKKEAWEIEAENRGKRRKIPEINRVQPQETGSEYDAPSSSFTSAASAGATTSHVLNAFYSSQGAVLTLPSSRAKPPPPKSVPPQTMPLSVILLHSWSSTLKSLVLSGRNVSPLIVLSTQSSKLETLEDLKMENCGLGERVRVSTGDEEETMEGIFGLIARLFPALQSADLSYNSFPTLAGILDILCPASSSRGIRELHVRGCGVKDLAEIVLVMEQRPIADWKLRDLDLCDNEITKLPARLGLLPVDVLLVDGNLFRVPPRRVWEKEGTKGLLGWLRDRIE